MSEDNKVLIIAGPCRRVKKYKGFLLDNGFTYPDNGGYIKCQRIFKPREKRELKYLTKKFSGIRGISCNVIDERFTRSTNYRAEYFKNNRPSPGGMYRCIYCGKFYPRDRITIDHIIPVYAAEHSMGTRLGMKFLGLKSINDVKNLGAACQKCNKRKGKKTGLWVIRGALGKTKWFWTLRFLFWLTVVLYALYVAVQNGFHL